MDYEIYTIEVTNNTDNTILLDTKTKQKSAYITSTSGTTYSAFMYELEDVYLTVASNVTKTISIKFNKIYSPNIKIEEMTFTDIVPNLEEYKTNLSTDRLQITIDI